MRLVRSNRSFGTWAALFALAIQLVLSFGHIHLEDIQGRSAGIAASAEGQPIAPADDDRGAPGHDFCAICAALSLTSSSVLPTVELPANPVDHAHKWSVDLHPERVSLGICLPFQARAPPHST
jgi:hypothetical protein